MRTCTGALPNFGFIIDGSVAEERHNLNQEHHLAHTATPILASLLMIHQKLNWPHKKKRKSTAPSPKFRETPPCQLGSPKYNLEFELV